MYYDRFQKMVGVRSSPLRYFLGRITSSGWWKKSYESVADVYGLDYRSLALFRFFLGLIIFGDTIDRWKNGYAHYADDGIWPRRDVLNHLDEPDWINVYLMGGSHLFVTIILFLHCLISLAFAIGFHTTTSTLLNWWFTTSILARNQLVGHGGDTLLRCLLFWSFFFPLGKVWSYDSAVKKFSKKVEGGLQKFESRERDYLLSGLSGDREMEREEERNVERSKEFDWRYVSVANICLVLQVAYVYSFSVYLKTDDAWTKDYNATFLALSLDYFRMPLGDFLIQFPTLLKFMTWAVAYWEFFGSLCYFIPFYQPHLRVFGVFGFISLHLGFGLCLRVGTFFWVGVAAHVILIPSWCWNVLFRYLRSKYPSHVWKFYYPRGCGYCAWCAELISTFFFLPETSIRPTSSTSSPTSYDQVQNHSSHPSHHSHHNLHYLHHSHQDRGEQNDHIHERESMINTAPHSFFDNQPRTWLVEDAKGTNSGYKAFLLLLNSSPILNPLHWLFRKRFIALFLQYVWQRIHPQHDHRHSQIEDYCPPNELRKTHAHPEEHHGSRNESDNEVDSFDLSRRQEREILENQRFSTYYQKEIKKKNRRNIKLFRKLFLSMIAIFFIIYITSWNFMTIQVHDYATPPEWRRFGVAFHLHQSWSMFAPKPPSINWWYVYEGTLSGGETIDFFRNRGIYNWEPSPLSFEKPDVNKCIGNHRWWKFFESYNDHPAREAIRLSYGRWMCRQWNSRHSRKEKLVRYKVWWVSEWNHDDGTHSFHNKILLWEHIC